MKILIIYHREDNDGVCSAGIVKACYKKMFEDKGVSFMTVGVNYADLTRKWEEYRAASQKSQEEADKTSIGKWKNCDEVWMCDISFNELEAMDWLYSVWGTRFHWCDHHKPVIDSSEDMAFGRSKGIRDTKQSALMNTWQHIFTDTEESAKIKNSKPSAYMEMLSDYDSWAHSWKEEYKEKWRVEQLFDTNTGFTLKSNLSVKWYTDWITDWINGDILKHLNTGTECREYGNTARQLDKARQDRAVNAHGDMSWRILHYSRPLCMIFTTERMNSQSFNLPDGIKNAATLKYDAKNAKWIMSLYNMDENDDFHCGNFLKTYYGGGGHKGAAGCTLETSQVAKMIQLKYI